MQMHFPEVTQINNASGSDDIIIGLYIGQTTPEAEMLKRLNFSIELHIIHPESRPLFDTSNQSHYL